MHQVATADSLVPSHARTFDWRAPRLQRAFKLLLLFIVTILAMAYRRPDQFASPTLWVEDGLSVPAWIEHGWLSLFHPIQGYFSLPIRFLHALAETLSFRWLPELGLWLSVLFTYGVLATIATAPTTLRLPFVCAATALAIPCDSEVFAVSLYAGWWGSLLLFPPLLWRSDGKPRTALRLSLIVLGGLSSPLVMGVAPLYALRAAVRRTRADTIACIVCVLTALMQFVAIRQSGIVGSGLAPINLSMTFEKFFGYFVVQHTTPGLAGDITGIGMALAAFIAVGWLLHRRTLGLTFVLVAGALCCAIAASVTRVPIEAIHPKLAGPRYFFYPFVLLSWLVAQLAALEHAVVRVVATAVLALAVRNGLEVAQRRHEPIDWRANVAQCVASTNYAMPIHYTGELQNAWKLPMTGEQCRQLVRASLFDNHLPP